MRIAKHVGVATVLLMLSVIGFSQQLHLGKNPYTLRKSAVLELESDNQGLLFPRITDTTLINTLTPPDGMVIFHQPSAQLMVRSGGYWKALTSSNLLAAFWSINGNSNGSVKTFGNSDNFDLPFITNNTERMRILSGGNVGIGTNNPLQKLDVNGNMNLSGAFMPANNAGTAGYVLRSNGAGTAPSWINPLLSGLSDVTVTTPANGQLLQYNGTKWVNFTPSFLTTIDTTNISNFYVKVRSLFTAAAPLTFANGQFGITQATTSTNGYLSNTDWNTFNNKLSSVDTTSIANFSQKVRGLFSAGTGITYNSSTGNISNSGVISVNGNSGALTMDTSYISNFYTKVRSLFSVGAPLTYANGQFNMPKATGSVNGYLSSTDWTTFNNKLSSVDTTSITNFSQKVRGLLSAGTGISYNSTTGVIGNSGVLSLNGNTGALTMDTSYISNFHLKTKSLFSAGTGITYNSTTGSIVNSGVLSVNGNTGALTVDTGYINNFHLKVKSLFNAGTGITYNPVTGQISSSVTTANTWGLTGNSNTVAGTSFLGTTDDKPLILKSNNSPYAEMGRRQTLGLVQSYTDYTDPDEQVLQMKSAVQFYAPAAQFYKPKIYVDASGNFRTKGSSAGTDYFEFGATGTNNDGGFEFIIGDDGDEPIVFKSYNYLTGMSEMMRLQSGRMAVGSNAFNSSNPEKLLIDAGVTDSYNLMTGKGTINNYLQINVQNRSNGNNASSDIVATADNGDEGTKYIDMGINSSGFSNSTYPVIGGINNAYLYSTGNDFVIGNATTSKSLRFFTGGYSNTNERLRIDGTGNVGIGTTAPTSILHVKSGTTDVSGVRMENLTSSSASTTGAATLGVDANGNVVRAKAPVYYTGGANGGTATVDGITKVWLAEVANTGTGTQTVTIPTNVAFSSIVNITLTTKGGTDATNSPIAMVTSNTTTQIVIRVLESKLTTVVLGGNVEGLEPHINTATKIYIRVEGN